jgi:hypothetical protein
VRRVFQLCYAKWSETEPSELSARIVLHRCPTRHSQLTREPCSQSLGGEGVGGHDGNATNNTTSDESDGDDTVERVSG